MAGKRKNIPNNVKFLVWHDHFGYNMEGICPCCERRTITFSSCHFGHILAVNKEGSNEPQNLKPICSQCNLGMKTMGYYEYKQSILGGGFPAKSKSSNKITGKKTITQDGLLGKRFRKMGQISIVHFITLVVVLIQILS